MVSPQHPIRREGLTAGLIGAGTIALWFGLIDLVRGEPLSTPITLGTALGSLFLEGRPPDPTSALIGYTVFHVLAFLAVGVVVAWVLHQAERVPSAMIGFLGLFVVFEVGWVGWTTVLSQTYGGLPWLQVFAANLLAAGSMGWYLWRRHPTLSRKVDDALAGQPQS